MDLQIRNLTDDHLRSGSSEERIDYFNSFLTEAVLLALSVEWDMACRYESARVLTTASVRFCRLATVST